MGTFFTYIAEKIKAGKGKITGGSLTWASVQWFWSGLERLINNPANLATIGSTLYTCINQASKKDSCTDFTYVVRFGDTVDGTLWVIAGSPTTSGKNCDTQASRKDIIEAIDDSIADIVNREAVGLCTRLHNGCTWTCDLIYINADFAADCTINISKIILNSRDSQTENK